MSSNNIVGGSDHSLSNPGISLSPRQREVLKWTALGKTSWETSVIMRCTEATVNYHLKQVFRKLDVSNKTHAVSRAFVLGLIGG